MAMHVNTGSLAAVPAAPTCARRCLPASSAAPRPSTSTGRCSLGRPQLQRGVAAPLALPPVQRRTLGARHVMHAKKAATDGWWHEGEELWTFVHSEKEFQDVVANAPNLVLVDCFTPWCGGCKLIYPQLCRLAMDDQLKKQCTFVKVDTDEMGEWAAREKVKTLPYTVFYRSGEGRLLGMTMDPQRTKLLRGAIATLADNRGKSFRLDPNGYVVSSEPAGLAA